MVGNGAPGGDKWVVNGKIQPKLTVRRRKYRFRILNTGPAKTWNLSLVRPDGTQAPLTIVAVDANFLPAPVTLTNRTLDVFVAMRFDVIVDFAEFPAGTSVYLKEQAAQNVGVATADPAPGLPIGNVLMRFDVVNREAWFPADTPAVPAVLATRLIPSCPTLRSSGISRWSAGASSSTDWSSMRTASTTSCSKAAPRNGRSPTMSLPAIGCIRCTSTSRRAGSCRDGCASARTRPYSRTCRCCQRRSAPRCRPMPPQNRVVMRLRFRDFVGRYLIHCHNMNHEDAFMMVRWDIVDSVEELTRRRREIDERRMLAGLPPQYLQQGGLV